MDPRRNPYAPGAGSPPPILAGRDDLVAGAELALARVRAGRHAKSFIAVGLRGVGKTVILNKVQDLADELGYQSVYIEAYDDVALPDALSKGLRPALLRLDRMAGAQDVARRGLRILRSFAGTFRVSIQGFDLSIAPEEGTADTGDLATDLTELMLAVGQAAAAQRTSVALILDEIQYLAERDLAPLIMAMHRVNQKQFPLVLFAAGLPQVRGQMGEAKSYVERLFDFPAVDALDANDARRAVAEPARSQGIEFTEEALDEIVRVTAGYPYFFAGVGTFRLAAGRHVADPEGSGPGRARCGDSATGYQLLPCAAGPHDADREALHARDGGTRPRRTSVRRYRSRLRCKSYQRGSHPKRADFERNDLQPGAR